MKYVHSFSRLVFVVVAVFSFGLVARADQKLEKKDVPRAVIAAFEKAYPNATVRGYGKEREGGHVYYEIESTDGNVKRDILYRANGSVVEMEETIPPADTPDNIRQAIEKQFPGAELVKVEKTTAGTKIGYEVSAKQGKRRISLEMNADGKILKKTVK